MTAELSATMIDNDQSTRRSSKPRPAMTSPLLRRPTSARPLCAQTSLAGLMHRGVKILGRLSDQHLEPVIPGAADSPDPDPGDADCLQFASRLDAANVDDAGPAEIGQHVTNRSLCLFIVTGNKHRRLAFFELRIDKVRVADRIEGFDHLGAGQGSLDAFAERVVARD